MIILQLQRSQKRRDLCCSGNMAGETPPYKKPYYHFVFFFFDLMRDQFIFRATIIGVGILLNFISYFAKLRMWRENIF